MALPFALNEEHQSALHAAIGSFRNMFGAGPVGAATLKGQDQALTDEAQQLFDVKAKILTDVRATMAEGERPTLEHYRLACEAHAETEQGKAMVERGEWHPKVHADLSGHDLSGFTLSEPKKMEAAHYLNAQKKPEEETHGHHNTIGKNYDGNDLDGDGQINIAAQHPFYDNFRCEKGDLHGCFVEPATSFNDEIAKAGNLKGLTFNGMQEGDTFTFGAGQYKDVHMTNVHGGEIVFADKSHVDGVSIEGAHAKISIGDHASVNHIEVGDNFRILSLEMGKNSVISHSDLRDSTVSMQSQFQPGAKFDHVQLGGNVQGLDFTGLKLHNVTIDGILIQHSSQLGEFGITHDHTTQISAVAHTAPTLESPEAGPHMELEKIRATLQGAVAYSGNANHTEIAVNTQVASMERTVPIEHQAQGTNMQRTTT